jgi:hypothetical protein
MSVRAAVPFVLKRGEDAMTSTSIESMRETIHGVIRLEQERVVLQWRVGRKREVYGTEMRVDKELEPVRQVEVRLDGLAGAVVRHGWLGWLLGPKLVLTAADLAAFEVVAGAEGLRMDHPAQLHVRVRRRDRLLAEEFCAELALALAERSLAGPTLADPHTAAASSALAPAPPDDPAQGDPTPDRPVTRPTEPPSAEPS